MNVAQLLFFKQAIFALAIAVAAVASAEFIVWAMH
jgi:hypothetical protein